MDHAQYLTILKQAVENENEAYKFYHMASEKVVNLGIKRFFANLAQDELKHKALLENYIATGSQMLQFDETYDYKVSDVIEMPVLTTEMAFKDAVALATKKEHEALIMYTGFANASTDNIQKQVFLELAKMESDHKAGLEEIYINAAFVEVW